MNLKFCVVIVLILMVLFPSIQSKAKRKRKKPPTIVKCSVILNNVSKYPNCERMCKETKCKRCNRKTGICKGLCNDKPCELKEIGMISTTAFTSPEYTYEKGMEYSTSSLKYIVDITSELQTVDTTTVFAYLSTLFGSATSGTSKQMQTKDNIQLTKAITSLMPESHFDNATDIVFIDKNTTNKDFISVEYKSNEVTTTLDGNIVSHGFMSTDVDDNQIFSTETRDIALLAKDKASNMGNNVTRVIKYIVYVLGGICVLAVVVTVVCFTKAIIKRRGERKYLMKANLQKHNHDLYTDDPTINTELQPSAVKGSHQSSKDNNVEISISDEELCTNFGIDPDESKQKISAQNARSFNGKGKYDYIDDGNVSTYDNVRTCDDNHNSMKNDKNKNK